MNLEQSFGRKKIKVMLALLLGIGDFGIGQKLSGQILTSGLSNPSDSAGLYEKKQILFLPWANNRGEKDIKYGGNPYCGSPSFGIDQNENIYIAEEWNKRIQVYSNSGDFIKSLPVDSALFMQVDDDGNIFTNYFIDNKWPPKIMLIKKDGQVTRFNQPLGKVFNNALYDDKGNQIFSFNKILSTKPTKFNQPFFYKDLEINYDWKNQNPEINVQVTMEKVNHFLQAEGKTTGSDSIKMIFEQKEGHRLDSRILGFDDDGNVYVLVGWVRLHFGNLDSQQIEVCSINGVLKTEIPIDIDSCYNSGVFPDLLKVDKQGDVFQLLNSETGVYVYKWIKKQ